MGSPDAHGQGDRARSPAFQRAGGGRSGTPRALRATSSARALLALLFIILLDACSPPADPRQVATEFWRAQMAGETSRLHQLVREADSTSLDGRLDVLPLRSFELGEMKGTDDSAEFATEVVVAGDTPLHLHLTTVLVRTSDGWRINYPATVGPIASDSPLAKLITKVQTLTARLGAGVNQSLEELKRAIPKLEGELLGIEKDIRSQVPELRRRLEDLLQGLEDKKPSSPTSPPPPDFRKAI